MTISFRAGNNYPTQNLSQQNTQQKNSIGLTENGQNVLNKTNEYANAYNLADTLVDSQKRKGSYFAIFTKKMWNDDF